MFLQHIMQLLIFFFFYIKDVYISYSDTGNKSG